MQLAVQTPLVPGSSLAERWEVASRLGFDALECRLSTPGEETLGRVARLLRERMAAA